MTSASDGLDDLSHTPDKTTTTVAMDFGRVTLDAGLILYLFGTPGQHRFWFMWDDLIHGAIGAVVLVDTRRLAEGYFELRELGPVVVKGVSEAVNVYEVIGIGAARGHFELAMRRGLTKFVGREREMEARRHALEQARAGHGQIAAAVAALCEANCP